MPDAQAEAEKVFDEAWRHYLQTMDTLMSPKERFKPDQPERLKAATREFYDATTKRAERLKAE